MKTNVKASIMSCRWCVLNWKRLCFSLPVDDTHQHASSGLKNYCYFSCLWVAQFDWNCGSRSAGLNLQLDANHWAHCNSVTVTPRLTPQSGWHVTGNTSMSTHYKWLLLLLEMRLVAVQYVSYQQTFSTHTKREVRLCTWISYSWGTY